MAMIKEIAAERARLERQREIEREENRREKETERQRHKEEWKRNGKLSSLQKKSDCTQVQADAGGRRYCCILECL